ncbi:WecB/TagA/CpsF family glycosyltransferase [Gordonia sp. SW 21]|uniref:WecB/TagA/CpsF family glycosyltransferase n=1 Tax=Gordonia aquimaris TaxID=2984863 RepID=A0A9X3D7I8_9ACTN|nr:WecB/TagA/CpsF family glycosyltransferase [Gordonia aquimaris]MCX2965389.1 WecB/TagA/CpsF family glycosyltransferase [Gordonia aquimaris]
MFNPDYQRTVEKWNPSTTGSPTWFDPQVFYSNDSTKERKGASIKVVWVGRLERPKDPALAVESFKHVASNLKGTGRTIELRIIGDGTQRKRLEDRVNELPADIQSRIHLTGRLDPLEVASHLRDATVFLMTSHPGYEGYPRVLVEAMACGTPAVVTTGSDTGSLVEQGVSGYEVTERDAAGIGRAIISAANLDRSAVKERVSHLSAESVIGKFIYNETAKVDGLPKKTIARTRNGYLTIAGRSVFCGNICQLLDQFDHTLSSMQKSQLIVTANVDQVVRLELPNHDEARRVFEAAAKITIDGKPLVWLGSMMGARDLSRITGADLLSECAKQSKVRQWNIVVLGGQEGAAERAALRLSNEHPGASVVGVDLPQNISEEEQASSELLNRLKALRPAIVFICAGFPKQEVWYLKNMDRLPRAIYVGAGAAVDFAAGERRRAPVIIQNVGLEWMYRLAQEPRRLGKRYLVDDLRFAPIAVRSLVGGVRK